MAKTREKKWYEKLSTVGEKERIDQLARIKQDSELHPAALFTLADLGALTNVMKWLADGRGMRRWSSVDLSAPRPDQLTPGDSPKPHYAYVDEGLLRPDQVRVEHRQDVLVPIKWYPGCHKCKGSKVRTVAEMAQIWKVTEAEALVEMQKPDWTWGAVTDGTFPCNYCQGEGHTREPFIIQVTRKPMWVTEVSNTGKRNAVDMCCRLQKEYRLEHVVSWDWEWYGRREAIVKFFAVWSELLSEYLARQEPVAVTAPEQDGSISS